MRLVDSHAHLDKLNLSDIASLEAMLERAASCGVFQILSVATTLDESDKLIERFSPYPQIFCSAGIHPQLIQADDDIEHLRALAYHPEIIAIGETGLDFSEALERREQNQQIESFYNHIAIAQEVDKPLIVHTRNASRKTFDVLRNAQSGSGRHSRGVIHCFTEDRETAKAALDLGFYISFSGIITFKNATALRTVAKYVPLDHLLLETDSPYLAPVPYRGKCNEPAYLPYTAEQVSVEKACPIEVLAYQTTQNFNVLFGIKALA